MCDTAAFAVSPSNVIVNEMPASEIVASNSAVPFEAVGGTSLRPVNVARKWTTALSFAALPTVPHINTVRPTNQSLFIAAPLWRLGGAGSYIGDCDRSTWTDIYSFNANTKSD